MRLPDRLVPLQPSVEVGNSNEQTSANKPSPPPPVSRDMLEGLQIRAELLQQKHPMAEQNSTRGRHAIGAYGALKNSEERDRISSPAGRG